MRRRNLHKCSLGAILLGLSLRKCQVWTVSVSDKRKAGLSCMYSLSHANQNLKLGILQPITRAPEQSKFRVNDDRPYPEHTLRSVGM